MKSLSEKIESNVKLAEERLKSTKGISGMTLYNLKRENYVVIAKEHFDNLISELKKIDL